MHTKSLKTTLFCSGAWLVLATTGTAHAQAPAEAVLPPPTTAPTTTSSSETGADIVVTGTRVIRDGYKSPTPLTVVTRDDIENTSPTNNIADLVNQLPALGGSTRPSNSRLELSSGIAGVNLLNLRNAGIVRTLVLVDGRR